VNPVLSRWNALPSDQAAAEILPCCGSQAWAIALASSRPLQDVATLLDSSDRIWLTLSPADWLQAFHTHPRIGGSANSAAHSEGSSAAASARSANWSSQEQSRAADADDSLKRLLSEGNQAYEQKFGRTFIIFATGKTASEILQQLHRRLESTDAAELLEAAEQQRQITRLRLRKWLAE
jgi:2-oxo-4-hydroxy-4-carboxy-5-ureidoimidazoline decarboxylase